MQLDPRLRRILGPCGPERHIGTLVSAQEGDLIMATVSLQLGSATAEEARAFVLAFQTTREYGLPKQITTEPTVQIMGVGWHVQTPSMSLARAMAMAAKLEEK